MRFGIKYGINLVTITTLMYRYKAPLTAVRYLNGLQKEIERLSVLADTLPYYSRPQLQKYGQNTKRINYKKMAIIFAIYGPIVMGFLNQNIIATIVAVISLICYYSGDNNNHWACRFG